MKRITGLLFLILIVGSVFGQQSGNVNYQNKFEYSDNDISVNFPVYSDLLVSIKGLANVKADNYVAMFNVTQVGKTTKEVNNLIDERINKGLENIKSNPEVKIHIDMISFVPIYEYEVEKKIFSKTNYNEVPVGFELKKNIHIKYSNPDLLNEIITALSKSEIYDLVKVDYFSNNLDSIKTALSAKARVLLQEKLKNYESILSANLDSAEKRLIDGYKIVLPVEMYRSYEAHSSASLNFKKAGNIRQANKSKVLYYQPVMGKAFDFVINPIILKPVIQIMYELKLKINMKKDEDEKSDKTYILITPNGEMKKLDIK